MEVPTIRPASIEDALSISTLSGQLGYPASVEQTRARLAGLIGSKDHSVLVACLGSRVVGWIHVFLAHRVESDSFAELGGFVVDEACRRSGIGKRLLVEADAWAKERHVSKMRVRSRTDREDARAFYSNIGFSTTKEQRVFDKPIQ